MNYFTALDTQHGVNRLSHNACKLLDFQLVVLGPNESTNGNSADREILAVLLGGQTFFRASHTPSISLPALITRFAALVMCKLR